MSPVEDDLRQATVSRLLAVLDRWLFEYGTMEGGLKVPDGTSYTNCIAHLGLGYSIALDSDHLRRLERDEETIGRFTHRTCVIMYEIAEDLHMMQLCDSSTSVLSQY